MKKERTIKKCPLCKGELQASRTVDLVAVEIDSTGEIVHSQVAYYRDAENFDERVYCENDHTLGEILDELDRKAKRRKAS